VLVQVVLVSQTEELRAELAARGIATETEDEIAPIRVRPYSRVAHPHLPTT
jgi:hypothetical protein